MSMIKLKDTLFNLEDIEYIQPSIRVQDGYEIYLKNEKSICFFLNKQEYDNLLNVLEYEDITVYEEQRK